MKPVPAFLTVALLGCSIALAADLDSILKDLKGNDYDARQEARNELYSMAADATQASGSNSSRNLTAALMDALQSPDLDQQGKVFLTRIITRIGSEEASDDLLSVAANSDVSPVVREHALMAMSALPGETVSGMLIDGLTKAAPEEKALWWQAVGHQLEASSVKDLLAAIKKAKLTKDSLGWQALGKIGGADAASYLVELLGEIEAPETATLERAILDTEGCTAKQLRELMSLSSDATIKTGAFQQLLLQDPSAALSELKASMGGEPTDLRQRMIRLALETGDESIWSTVAKGISGLEPAEIDTFLACVAEQEQADYEGLAIKYLEVGVPNTQKEALRTLAAIGTKYSTNALLARMDTGDDEIDDLAIYALSQIDDPLLDEQIVQAVNDPGSDDRAQMIALIAVRNTEGATELLNSILQAGKNDPDLVDVLGSIEAIGDLNSCRILLKGILDNSSPSDVRKFQLSLKRLTIRLALNDLLWENAFKPALLLAADDEARANIVEILDCLSSPAALKYCQDCLKKNKPDALQSAAMAALRRWTNLNIADHWIDVLNDSPRDGTDYKTAMSSLMRLITTSSIDGSAGDKAQVALDAALQVDDKEFLQLLMAEVADNNALLKQFNDKIESYRNIIELLDSLD